MRVLHEYGFEDELLHVGYNHEASEEIVDHTEADGNWEGGEGLVEYSEKDLGEGQKIRGKGEGKGGN
jgi:hypothetical protein